jgi:hypothetical protein
MVCYFTVQGRAASIVPTDSPLSITREVSMETVAFMHMIFYVGNDDHKTKIV